MPLALDPFTASARMALTDGEEFSVVSKCLVLGLGLSLFGLIQWEVKSTEMRAYLLIVIIVAFNLNNYYNNLIFGTLFGGLGMVGIVLWNRHREGKLLTTGTKELKTE